MSKDSEYDEVNKLVEELLYGLDEAEAEAEAEWKREKEQEKLAEEEWGREWRATLLGLVNRNSTLRDNNFVDSENLLVWLEGEEHLTVVPLYELPVKFPVEVPEGRWQDRDFGRVLRLKFVGFRQSLVAKELAAERPEGSYRCSTVVLFVPKNESKPYEFVELTANAR